MDLVSIFFAFAAGILSFLSPCVLPLVPAYVSYLTGAAVADINNQKAKRNLLFKSVGFILGFTIVFLIMGVSISSLSKLFKDNQDIFRMVGGALIVVFGIHTTGLLKIKALYGEKRLFRFGGDKKVSPDAAGAQTVDGAKGASGIGAVFVGMAFATGWTPCVGPILSTILIYAGSLNTITQGVVLLLVYSLGLAVPFLLTALAIGSFSSRFKKFSKYLPVVSIVSGILMILMGILIFTNTLSRISGALNFINF
ncbi:MAG: cytochrome c biogenesis protein CcdA [Clostridia bacterium]